MRHLGFFSKGLWDYQRRMPLLASDEFTTMRYPRQQPLEIGEVLSIIYKPQTKETENMGIAEVASIEPRSFGGLSDAPVISLQEVLRTGFQSLPEMITFMTKLHGIDRIYAEPMELLTIRWVKREVEIG